MGIESNNEREGALSGFFSCGSTNMLEDFGESNLAILGVGWEEQLFHLFFPNNGVSLLLYVLITVCCLF